MTWELTPELEKKIIKKVVDGYSFRKIGRMDDMPSRDTIMRWEREYPDFATNVARARDVKNEDDVDRLEEINELVLSGKLEPNAAVAVSNNIKWVASKLMPKKYGDSSKLEMSGAGGGAVIMKIVDDIANPS